MVVRKSHLGLNGLLVPLVAFTTLVLTTACDQRGSQAVFSSPKTENKELDQQESKPVEKAASSEEVDAPPKKRTPIPRASDELFERGISATVRLIGPEMDASGVILGKLDGSVYILTVEHAARHNLEQVEVFSTTSHDPVARSRQLSMHGEPDPRRDLAILKARLDDSIPITSVRCVGVQKPSDDSNAEPIEFGYSVGCSDGSHPTLLRERITGSEQIRVAGSKKNALMWTTERPQTPGRSGGPLIGVQGSLLGVALGKRQSQGFYCHWREIRDYLIDNGLHTLVRCAE